MRRYRFMIIAVLYTVLLGQIFSQQFISVETNAGNVKDAFESAYKKGIESDGFWIGYSIIQASEYRVSVGSFYLNFDYGLSLRDIISRAGQVEQNKIREKKHKSNRIVNGRIINRNDHDKETAILFKYRTNSTGFNDFAELAICNLSQNIDLDNLPLLWLGNIKLEHSAEFIMDCYSNIKEVHSRKELLPALGIHSSIPGTTDYLIDQFENSSSTDIKEEIAFWLGFQDNLRAFNQLRDIIYNETNGDIRQKAVMGLGQQNLKEALKELISIARKFPDTETRKEAVMWLGNKAVRKADEELKNIIEADPDIEIKKTAVYALANNSDDNIPYLIKIANTNRSLQLRKCAIWALGSSEDSRAVEALISLARNNN